MRDTQWDEQGKTATAAKISANMVRQRFAFGCAELETLASAPKGVGSADQLSYEVLGRRDMEGVAAVGCRLTRLFMSPRSSFQGKRSITEMWSSPELQIELLTTILEADGAEEVLKITDLQRVEPDPALFRVPPGCTDRTTTP